MYIARRSQLTAAELQELQRYSLVWVADCSKREKKSWLNQRPLELQSSALPLSYNSLWNDPISK